MNSKHVDRWEELCNVNPNLAREYLRIYTTMDVAQKHFNRFKSECESWLDNIYKTEVKHMNAIEMFKKLGYKYNKYRNRNQMIEYRKEDSTSVLFWIKERKFSVSEYCEPKDITVDEFKAIQKQMEELGWI